MEKIRTRCWNIFVLYWQNTEFLIPLTGVIDQFLEGEFWPNGSHTQPCELVYLTAKCQHAMLSGPGWLTRKLLEGQVMRSYRGLYLIWKQSVPQLQHQPHWATIYLLTSARLSKTSQDEGCCLRHPGTWCTSHVARWWSYFSPHTSYVAWIWPPHKLQSRSDATEDTGSVSKEEEIQRPLKVKSHCPVTSGWWESISLKIPGSAPCLLCLRSPGLERENKSTLRCTGNRRRLFLSFQERILSGFWESHSSQNILTLPYLILTVDLPGDRTEPSSNPAVEPRYEFQRSTTREA